ncbi:hypothetical protein H4Q26_011668 [Puccinia striiformis f. sp. tritici PST-130]|nr:hypothetical protein H4Q26_011668 [Puccinia striiformis f. sp. tritici PST-130]
MDRLGARSKGATVSFTASEDITAVFNNTEAEIGDIELARALLACLTKSNSKLAPGWIAAAQKQENAKLVLADAGIHLPHSVKIWYKAVELALYSKFRSHWSDSKEVSNRVTEFEFQLLACYNVQPQPVETNLPQFHEETLFFIFYSQPRSLMQELVALEFYKRNMRK